ncbi:DUF3189 family protein [Gracilibacillus alcaliphilus]|uniref:DUF3189 family protein n=1 Tax=Gracilibacillus alcaliphilus TaxID=1401441 RepID=UPI001957D417|nr:DUF3189 family protein [Gracilibacillus alcaliphilus]MBM7676313.1 hypothetical protein [Gracilibacillus alcaliphilus]
MIFIYNDYGGTHTTSLAAAYHLKKLPVNRKLTKDEVINTDYFNKLTKQDFGKLIFHGVDQQGHSVYTIGRKNNKYVVPALEQLVRLLQEQHGLQDKVILSNTSPTVPLALTIGGMLSRGLHLDFLGVPFLIMGARQCCLQIQQLVKETKEAGQRFPSKVIVLENKSFQ